MRSQDVLPDHVDHVERDGLAIRKGTVAAFLANARTWCDPQATSASRAAAERDIIEALPALRALHLFEIMAVRDPALRQLITDFERQAERS